MCNGLVEKFNGTLKIMLKQVCAENPHDWDKYLKTALFTYREVPQERLGFFPIQPDIWKVCAWSYGHIKGIVVKRNPIIPG